MSSDTMRLAEKGPVVPVPMLPEPLQMVSAKIQSWLGIIAATHWNLNDRTKVDGADFYVGAAELGHIHSYGEMHLAATVPLRRELVARRLAQPFPWYDSWVQFTIRSTADADHAIWLFRLNYDRLYAVSQDQLAERILSYKKS